MRNHRSKNRRNQSGSGQKAIRSKSAQANRARPAAKGSPSAKPITHYLRDIGPACHASQAGHRFAIDLQAVDCVECLRAAATRVKSEGAIPPAKPSTPATGEIPIVAQLTEKEMSIGMEAANCVPSDHDDTRLRVKLLERAVMTFHSFVNAWSEVGRDSSKNVFFSDPMLAGHIDKAVRWLEDQLAALHWHSSLILRGYLDGHFAYAEVQGGDSSERQPAGATRDAGPGVHQLQASGQAAKRAGILFSRIRTDESKAIDGRLVDVGDTVRIDGETDSAGVVLAVIGASIIFADSLSPLRTMVTNSHQCHLVCTAKQLGARLDAIAQAITLEDQRGSAIDARAQAGRGGGK